MALVASNYAIEIKQSQNLHLTATNILNDAVSMVDNAAKESRAAEEKTNHDYIKEIDREINLLNTERAHVNTGEQQAELLIGGSPNTANTAPGQNNPKPESNVSPVPNPANTIFADTTFPRYSLTKNNISLGTTKKMIFNLGPFVESSEFMVEMFKPGGSINYRLSMSKKSNSIGYRLSLNGVVKF